MRCLKFYLVLTLPFACDPTTAGVERPNLGTCLNACADGKASATDRATCRLTCGTVHQVPPTSAPPALAPVAHCMGACGKGGDTKACVDACRDRDSEPAVLDRLTTCVADCQAGDSPSDDDRATCRLLCAQEAALAR